MKLRFLKNIFKKNRKVKKNVVEEDKVYFFPKDIFQNKIDFSDIENDFIASNEDKNINLLNKNQIIDIILPVYNGLNFLKILIPQIIQNTDLPYRLIIINDCSPDQEIKLFLDSYSSISEFLIIHNDSNLGFTASVNKAIRLTSNHVVLLNTDTEVPKNWLSRLLYPIYLDDKIATVTPLSNCATIFSFPKMDDNPIFENLNTSELDEIIYSNVKPTFIEAPCGVGFCMAINKKAIEDIGILDEVKFAKGYGEEVDFCRRAIKKGYKNILIPNLFVYHKHGGSFDSNVKAQLINLHQKELERLHPDFMPEVHDFIKTSKLNGIRSFLILISCSKVAKKTIIYFDHELGGGANIYSEDFIQNNKTSNLSIVFSYIHPLHNPQKSFAVRYSYKEYNGVFVFDNIAELNKIFKYINPDELIIGSLITYSNLGFLMGFIEKIKTEFKPIVSYLVHDYHSICPNFTLMYKNESYCNIPSYEKCTICLQNLTLDSVLINQDFIDIIYYRSIWFNFLSKIADKIICFSSSAKEIVIKAYPNISKDKITVVPHIVKDYKIKNVKLIELIRTGNDDKINIGVLGNIHSNSKGCEIILELQKIIHNNKYNIELIIIGDITSNSFESKLKKTGAYDISNLHEHIIENKINAFFIPSIWPETFSYTTAEAILSKLPVFCFDIGGQADQVKKYEKGIIIKKIDAEEVLKEITKASNYGQWVYC